MTEFKVPELGENVAAGDVTRVLVNIGDTIKKDQAVLELETDKATIEVPSSVAGVVTDIKVKQGEKIKVGAVVLTVDESGGNGASAPPKAEAPAKAKAETPKADAAKAKAEPPASPEEPEPEPEGKPADAKPAAESLKVLSMPRRQDAPEQRPEPAAPPAAAPARATQPTRGGIL